MVRIVEKTLEECAIEGQCEDLMDLTKRYLLTIPEYRTRFNVGGEPKLLLFDISPSPASFNEPPVIVVSLFGPHAPLVEVTREDCYNLALDLAKRYESFLERVVTLKKEY